MIGIAVVIFLRNLKLDFLLNVGFIVILDRLILANMIKFHELFLNLHLILEFYWLFKVMFTL